MIRTLLTAALGIALASCSGPDPLRIDDLAEASGKAYDLLEPELRKAAETFLVDCRRQSALYGGKPSVSYYESGTTTSEYESGDGKIRKTLTRRTYVLVAEQTVVKYEVRHVTSITMLVSRQTPFEGQVEFLVTHLVRKREETLTLPPIPPGFRAREDGPVSESSRVVVLQARSSSSLALPVSPEPTEIPNDAPEEIKAAVPALKEACLQSETKPAAKSYDVKFQYSSVDKRWKH